jgi:predicted amidohydrolase
MPDVLICPPMAPGLKVAALQMTSTEDVDANLARASALATEAAAAGAALIGFPENFAYLGSDLDHRLSIAEALPAPAEELPAPAEALPSPDLKAQGGGPILTAMQALARQTGAWLLLGGFPERAASPTHIRNTSVLLRADGSIAAVYRKIHLFDVDVPGGKRFRESETVEPGSEAVVAETPWGPLGLTICYDLRFPELYRTLTARGARLLAVPSAFTLETGKDHWSVLLRARAIENQAYLFAPAQFGHHGGNRRSWGHAMVVDPWGAVLAECGDHEGFALASVDLGYQDRVRASLPCLTHRKVRGDA